MSPGATVCLRPAAAFVAPGLPDEVDVDWLGRVGVGAIWVGFDGGGVITGARSGSGTRMRINAVAGGSAVATAGGGSLRSIVVRVMRVDGAGASERSAAFSERRSSSSRSRLLTRSA